MSESVSPPTTKSAISKPELVVGETWDSCAENIVRNLGYGIIGGALVAAALFRAPTARAAVAGLGAGVGIGAGYSDCTHKFDALEKEAK